MAGLRTKRTSAGNCVGFYQGEDGRQKFFVGNKDKRATLDATRELEYQAKQIRKGVKEPREKWEKSKALQVQDVITDYLEWGKAQGGRHEYPWSSTHARNIAQRLNWWVDFLKLKSMGDLVGILGAAEKGARLLQKDGRVGKTISDYISVLKSFCQYAEDREYILKNPVRKMRGFNKTPKVFRSALSVEDVEALIKSNPPHINLLLEFAFRTGFRKNEIAALTLDDLSDDNTLLYLRDKDNKGKIARIFQIPADFGHRLREFSESGEPLRLYRKHCKRRDSTKEYPQRPLVFVPTHAHRVFDTALKEAGIPKSYVSSTSIKYKLDFHASRTTFINLVLDTCGNIKTAMTVANVKSPSVFANPNNLRNIKDATKMKEYQDNLREAMERARHTKDHLTLHVYGRENKQSVSEAVSAINAKIGY